MPIAQQNLWLHAKQVHGRAWPFQANHSSAWPCGHAKQAMATRSHSKQAHGCARPCQASPWPHTAIPNKPMAARVHVKHTMIQAMGHDDFND